MKTLKETGYEYVYDAVEKPLIFAQTAAFLEVISEAMFLLCLLRDVS